MYWQYTSLISQIDNLLDKEDITLQEILDEDDVLQECKAYNKKLVDFFIIPKNLAQLVDYVVTDPPEEALDTVKYKYPNLACELLSSDVTHINDALTCDDTYLDQFYDFLSREPPLNPLSASFYMKVMVFLVQKKGERIISYLKSKESFISRVVNHLDTSAIMDLLLKMIVLVDSQPVRQEMTEWFAEEQLVRKIVDGLDPKADENLHSNASVCMSELIITCRDQLFRHGSLRPDCFNDESESEDTNDCLANGILDAIEDPSLVKNLLSNMFREEEGIVESLILSGMSVLQTLLDKRKSESPLDPPLISPSETELSRLRSAANTVVEAVTPYLPRLLRLLDQPPPQRYARMPTTVGTLEPPLGNTRLQILRLLHSLLSCNHPSIFDLLHSLNFCHVTLNLFFTYNLNTFLHKTVTDIVCHLMSTAQPQNEESVHIPLLEQLMKNCALLDKILDVWQAAESEDARTRAENRSYMGHLCRMANSLTDNLEFASHKESVKQVFTSLGEDTQKKWQEFVEGPLKDYNERSTFDLDVSNMSLMDGSLSGAPIILDTGAGRVYVRPINGCQLLMNIVPSTLRSASVSDDGDDMLNLAFPTSVLYPNLQSAFNEYQSQQMTWEFSDERGFGEDSFADSLDKIESIFSEKIPVVGCEILTQEDTPNATMFEQACNEHMRQFDDPLEEELEDDDDEDVDEEDESQRENGEDDSPRVFLTPNGELQEDEGEDGWTERTFTRQADDGEQGKEQGNGPLANAHGSTGLADGDSSDDDDEDLNSPVVIRQSRSPQFNAIRPWNGMKGSQKNSNAVEGQPEGPGGRVRRVWESPREVAPLKIEDDDDDDDDVGDDEWRAVAKRMAKYAVDEGKKDDLVLTSVNSEDSEDSEEPATPRDAKRSPRIGPVGGSDDDAEPRFDGPLSAPMETPTNSPSGAPCDASYKTTHNESVSKPDLSSKDQEPSVLLSPPVSPSSSNGPV